MRFTRLAEHHLPLAGGMLDQTHGFCEAMDWIAIERRRWKSEFGLK